MTHIKQADIIASVADALQYISYFHPMDYILALGKAYEAEQSPAAKDAIAQILTNSRMCAEGHRPICQDTGIVVVFVEVGMNVWAESLAFLGQFRTQYFTTGSILPSSSAVGRALTRFTRRGAAKQGPQERREKAAIYGTTAALVTSVT